MVDSRITPACKAWDGHALLCEAGTRGLRDTVALVADMSAIRDRSELPAHVLDDRLRRGKFARSQALLSASGVPWLAADVCPPLLGLLQVPVSDRQLCGNEIRTSMS